MIPDSIILPEDAEHESGLEGSLHLRDLADNPKNQSAKVSRILSRFRALKLIAKIPRTRRWRVSDRGKQIRAASLCLRTDKESIHRTSDELEF